MVSVFAWDQLVLMHPQGVSTHSEVSEWHQVCFAPYRDLHIWYFVGTRRRFGFTIRGIDVGGIIHLSREAQQGRFHLLLGIDRTLRPPTPAWYAPEEASLPG